MSALLSSYARRGDKIQPPLHWVIFKLVPLLVLSCVAFRGTEDAFFEPRTVLDGTVVSKTYHPGIFGGGMMTLQFAERPYNFSIPARKLGKLPNGIYRFDSESSAVSEGLRTRVTILSRDLTAAEDNGPAATRITALRIEQHDREVFGRTTAILWPAVLALLVMVGYLSLSGRPTKQQWHALCISLDQRARHAAQFIHLIIATDAPSRADNGGRSSGLIRRGILTIGFMTVGLVMALLFWGTSYIYYSTLC
jgi:hypothetical protein